jgi:hypothetical protein
MFDRKLAKLIESPKLPWSREGINDLPKQNGVYVFARNDKYLYVGSSRNIYDRVVNHHWTKNNSALLSNLEEFFNTFYLDKLMSLDDYLKDCYIQYIVVDFGRAEIEDYIIETCNPILNNFRQNMRKVYESIDRDRS